MEQLQQTLMRQAQQPLDQTSDALVTANGASAMQQTLQQAFEQHSGSRRYAALHSASAATPASHSSGALVPMNPGALAFAHSAAAAASASPSPSLALSCSNDAEAYRSVAAVDAQLDALHESLRRFKFARMGQAMEFRAALPEATPALPFPAAAFNSGPRAQPQQLQMQQQQQARLLPPPQHQQAPSWPSAAAAPSSLSPEYPSSGLGSTATSAYAAHAPSQQQHPHAASYGHFLPLPVPAAPSAASISVIHSPANTLTRSMQLPLPHPSHPLSQLHQHPQQQQLQHPVFRHPTPPLSLDQQWMQQQSLSQQYAHLLSPSNALGASAPHSTAASSAAHAGMHLTRPDSGHRSARSGAAAVR